MGSQELIWLEREHLNPDHQHLPQPVLRLLHWMGRRMDNLAALQHLLVVLQWELVAPCQPQDVLDLALKHPVLALVSWLLPHPLEGDL